MAEISLSKEHLNKLANIGKLLKDKKMEEAEKMLEEFKTEYKIPPEFKTKDVTCSDCSYCDMCGPTQLTWVNVDNVVRVAGW